jgi:hypothetical protein
MTVATADDLRANLIGAWTLQSYVSMSIDGSDVVYPLGVDARGIIPSASSEWTHRACARGGWGHEGDQEAHCAEQSRRGDTWHFALGCD